MRVLEDLPTPCVLIDERRMEANLEQMAIKADGVRLRPHTKTHKSVALAKRQQLHGAVGITVAKVSEAEVFVQNGFDDVRIAYTLVGDQQLKRLAELSNRARISFCIDTKEGAHLASSVLAEAGVSIDVLLEIDTGYGRCGVPYNSNEVVELALQLNELEGLSLCGILTHEGDAYSQGALNASEVMAQTRDRMLDVAVRLAEAHCAETTTFEISMGSTPSINVFENNNKGGFRITEVRPGNYIFNDLTQVALGVCSLDACALTVLSTVVSHHRTSRGTERFILDSGRKVLTSDSVRDKPGYGCILYNPRTRVAHPHTLITGLSEEHGWCEVQGGGTFSVGDCVQIVPNHACVVVNMMDKIFLVDGSTVVSEIPIDARGCVI